MQGLTAHEFIVSLNERLNKLRYRLKRILRREEIIKDNVLVKQGFILRRYSIRQDRLSRHNLISLRNEIEVLLKLEAGILEDLKVYKIHIKRIEEDYFAYHEKRLKLENIFIQRMNNAFSLARLCQVRINELLEIAIGKRSSSKCKKIILSLERMTNQIIRFVDIVEQLEKILAGFEQKCYFETEKIYGRVMSIREFEKMKKTNKLSSSQSPVPVFDAPPTVRLRIIKMSRDEKEVFFRAIGIRSINKIVFFSTRLKPTVGPIPQSNNLREYKFPKGINVKIEGHINQ